MEVWEQHEGESDTAYSRFLVFRNLGANRTVELAFEGSNVGNPKISKNIQIKIGTWYKDSSKFNWRARASAWDIESLNRAGEKLVLDHIEFVQKLLEMGLTVFKDGKVKPVNVDELLAIGNFVGSYITPQTIERFRERADRGRVVEPPTLPPGE